MAQSIEIRYWRRPWLTPLIFCLLNASVLAFQLWECFTSSQPFHLKPVVVAFVLILTVVLLNYYIYYLSKSIYKISIEGGRVTLTRRIGRSISADASSVEIYKDVLRIGKYNLIMLDGMVNKEQVKDMLAGHVKVYPKDTCVIHILINVFGVLFTVLSVLLLALIFLEQSSGDSYIWAYVGFLTAFSVGFSAWTIWNLTRK